MNAAILIAIASAAFGQSSDVSYVQTITTDLQYAARLAPAPGDGVYVTDPPTNRVLQYDAAGALAGTYTIPQGPIGIAAHTDGRVFVSRRDGNVGVYSAAFTLQSLVSPAPLSMVAPNGMTFHAGELYVADSGSNTVLVFAETVPLTWTAVRAFGATGSGLGQLMSPQAVAVDPTTNHAIVADTDNFRGQVFDALGIAQFKFGYRILYTPTTEVAWVARPEGVAVDSCGNIYLTDALMGTVRVFDSLGRELGTTHTPLVAYGIGAGQLRVPGDVLINDSDRMFVASTNNAAVEVFDIVCTVPAAAGASEGLTAERELDGRLVKVTRLSITEGHRGTSARAAEVSFPDNPMDIVYAIHAGDYSEELDVNRDRAVDMSDLEMAVDFFGTGTIEDFLNMAMGGVATAGYDAPHVIDIPNQCGRCHSMDGAPGGMVSAAGQENLCQSCHSAGKIAGNKPIAAGDTGLSHPWGMAADSGDVEGPAAGSEVALHLYNGDVRCGTCHTPHASYQGTCQLPAEGLPTPQPHIGRCADGPFGGKLCQTDGQCELNYLRTTGDSIKLCGECHVEYEQWTHAGHADEHGEGWMHYDWNMGNNWLCTGAGTPYAYCTAENAGTATSAGTAICIAAGVPLSCCTGPGTGTCTVANASCLGPGSPWPCCTGTGAGTCANNLSAAACTGAGTPMTCCTGVGTGSCSNRESCRQCHSGNGYVDFSNDFGDGTVVASTHRGMFRVADCLVCHATHGAAQDEDLLRVYGTVRLPTGQVLSNVGTSATCMACHNGRALPPIPNPPGVTTPHYLSGGVMLEGLNGVTTFDGTAYVLTSSTHTSLLTSGALDCATCHMAAGPTSGPGVGKVGGHTFNLVDHESGFENVDNTCNAAGCHSGLLTTINRTANGNYDGDGALEGIQDETQGLMDLLKGALYAAGASRLLLNDTTGLPTYEPEICTAPGTPLACCTGVRTGPDCVDPEAQPTNPYWTTTRCAAGSRGGLPCRGTGVGTAPFDCPGSTCVATVPSGELATVEDAIWNWEYVDNSGDLGVKNTGYAVGLLQISYKGVANSPVPGQPPPAPPVAYRYSPAP